MTRSKDAKQRPPEATLGLEWLTDAFARPAGRNFLPGRIVLRCRSCRVGQVAAGNELLVFPKFSTLARRLQMRTTTATRLGERMATDDGSASGGRRPRRSEGSTT